jgi:hypothetical protein
VFSSGFGLNMSQVDFLLRLARTHRHACDGNFVLIKTHGDIFSRIPWTFVNRAGVNEFIAVSAVRIFMRMGIQPAELVGQWRFYLDGMGQVDIPEMSAFQFPAQKHFYYRPGMMPAILPIHLMVFGNILRNRNRRIS